MTIAWISLWAAALLLLPGWVIWRLAGPRGLPGFLEIAPSFALSLAVICLAAWSCFVLGLGFNGVKALAIAVLVLSALLVPVALWFGRPDQRESVSPGWTLWAAAALALGAGLSALYSGPWLSATADTFYHLAAIRSVLERGTALPQEIFFSTPVPAADPTSGAWPVVLALVSSLSGQDPLMVWRVMTVALPPVTVLAFFALALSITRNGVAALIASALYVVLALSLDFRDAALPNQFGSVLPWLALAFALRFVASGSRRELVAAAPIAFAASAIHPTFSPLLVATLASGLVATFVVRSPSRRRFAVAAAVVSAAALPLLIVELSTLFASAPYAAMAVTFPLPLRTIHHPWTWVWPSHWYSNPGTVLGTVFAVALVRLWRKGEAGAGLVVAVLVAIPAISLTPLFATTFNAQYLLARMDAVLQPLGWVSWGWGLALALAALRGRLRVPAAALVLVSVVAAAPAFYVGPLARFVLPAGSTRSFATSRSTDLTVAWRDRLTAIDKLPRSAVLLAEPRMAYELAGLTGREVVAVAPSHTPPQIVVRDGARRRADALDAVQGRLDAISLAGVIEHYGVTDVMVDMDRTDPAAWAQLAGAAILSPITGGDRWRLYGYDPSMLDVFLDLHTQAGPDPELAFGMGPPTAVAGRAVFARLQGNQGNAGTARLVADAVGSALTFSREVELSGAASSQTFALPIPSDAPAGRYRLTLVPSAGQSVALGQFDVGRLYQAEDMGGVVAGDSTRWSIAGGPDYQGSLAAVATRPGSATSQAILPVGAGSYCMAVRVYDDGSNRTNVLQATLAGAATRLSWSGSVKGMRWLRTEITVQHSGDQLGTSLIQRGQSRAIVDALEFYPLVAGACSSD